MPADVLHEMQVVDHAGIVLLGPGVLVPKNLGCRSGISREEDQDIVGQRVARILVERKWLRINRPVTMEREAGYAAERSDVLILLADRFFQQVDLDMTGLFRQLARVNNAARLGVQRPKQRSCKAAGRTKAGAGG